MHDEEGDEVKEFYATHEENFWSSWLRENERGGEERMAKSWRKKKRVKREKREEEKEGNETETVKRRCEGCVSVEAFEIKVKRETWRVAVVCLGRTSWRSLRVRLIVSLISVRMCVWCLL